MKVGRFRIKSFCFILQFDRGFKKGVINNDYINQLTASIIRATILSAEALLVDCYML